MSRIYWDTMLFAYWIEDREPYSDQVEKIFRRMLDRGDDLYASVLTVAELLVGPKKVGDLQGEKKIIEFFESDAVSLLQFDYSSAKAFGTIRASTNATAADSIHLACASVAGIDLFLTHNKKLRNLVIPNIQFIDGLDTTVLNSSP